MDLRKPVASVHAIVTRSCVGRGVGRGVVRPPQAAESEVQPSGQHNDYFEYKKFIFCIQQFLKY